jgi:hypothetical protein
VRGVGLHEAAGAVIPPPRLGRPLLLPVRRAARAAEPAQLLPPGARLHGLAHEQADVQPRLRERRPGLVFPAGEGRVFVPPLHGAPVAQTLRAHPAAHDAVLLRVVEAVLKGREPLILELLAKRERLRAVFVAEDQLPGRGLDPVAVEHRVRVRIEEDLLALEQLVGAVRNAAVFRPPALVFIADGARNAALDLQMDARRVRLGPRGHGELVALDPDLPAFGAERLRKMRLEGRGLEGNAPAPGLEQRVVLVEPAALREIQPHAAVLDPEIAAHVAPAEGHGFGGIPARRVPPDRPFFLLFHETSHLSCNKSIISEISGGKQGRNLRNRPIFSAFSSAPPADRRAG